MDHYPRTVKQVTDADAVTQALAEFDALGRDTFLDLYRYGQSREYVIEHEGKFYDSKPIIGVAFAYQYKGSRPLNNDDFSGGEATVEPQLEYLGFKVRRKSKLSQSALARLNRQTMDGDDETPTRSNLGDARKKVLASVMRRLGQPKFRKALLNAYDRQCAITGCGVAEVLEAAHIEPYSMRGLNKVTNGLLLRADLHTLFDLGLIAIDEKYRLLVSKWLDQSPYADLRGQTLRLPDVAAHRPSPAALKEHREASKAG